jgi:tetratricopeptide (TPR) repeat protein
MTANRQTGYCRRCGVRLARDNAREMCAACQVSARDLVLRPPDVPAAFWAADLMRDALESWHMGRVIAAYRAHPYHGRPIPQEIVGGWVGLTQAQLSRIENGPPIKDLDKLIQWARVLRIPPHLLWFKLPEDQPSVPTQRAEPLPMQLLSGANLEPFAFVAGASQPANGHNHVAAMQSFRAADRQVGGGHLYATVVKYLHTEMAPRLFGGELDGDAQLVFTAAAALTEMAGWMAHDAGRDMAAWQHFARSLDLVKVGGDRQLGVHVLASMSHLAHHVGRPDEAITYAQRGRDSLSSGPPQPELEARLLAMQARGFAALRRADDCTQLLHQAERVLTLPHAEQPSPWVSRFDEASLASEAARCLRQLGDLSEAQRQAERILALRPGDHTRSRAFGQLILVTVLIAHGRPDEACAVAQEVLDATQQLGSYLVIQQLLDLKQLLEPHRGNKVVADFLLCLDEALRERLWLYEWLTKDGPATVGAQ